jgi:hypothetical protein
MTNDVIATDQPLTPSQQDILSALLDTLVPASDDGTMPSARDLDFLGYLNAQAPDFIPVLAEITAQFDGHFASAPLTQRVAEVQTFSQRQPELFEGLVFHTYAGYYQDDRALVGIGMAAGPPFPRGNSVEAGDLSLLDPVVEKSKGYRRA